MQNRCSRPTQKLTRQNVSVAKKLYPQVTGLQLLVLREISRSLALSIPRGDLMMLEGKWYVTHSGLLSIAARRRCSGIKTVMEQTASRPSAGCWVFRATVFKSRTCRGFVGYGDADPSNVSALVHGAEMRVAETRAVNRALRKAYGIGICSVEETGSFVKPAPSSRESKKVPPQSVNGKNGNPRSATASANLSDSISSMPTSSSPTPSTSAAPRPSARPPVSRSKPSSPTWPTGPRKTAMPCSASSTVIR
jgi:hypothetical protein